MIYKKFLKGLLLVLSAFFINGCIPHYSAKTIYSQTPYTPFTNIFEKTSTNTIQFYPTPTELPTQSPSQEAIMLQNLLSNSCKLPCYLNITPGITSLFEARSLMDNIGAVFQGSYQGDLLDYFYFLHLGSYTLQPQNGSKYLGQSIDLYSEYNEILRVEFSIDIQGLNPLIQNYWKIYSMNNIIGLYGPPDKILFSLDVEHYLPNVYFEILYYYLKHGIEIELTGLSGENQICLDISHIVLMRMTLTDIYAVNSIFNPSWMQPSNTDYYSSINKVLGLNESDFSKKLYSDPLHCFTIIGK